MSNDLFDECAIYGLPTVISYRNGTIWRTAIRRDFGFDYSGPNAQTIYKIGVLFAFVSPEYESIAHELKRIARRPKLIEFLTELPDLKLIIKFILDLTLLDDRLFDVLRSLPASGLVNVKDDRGIAFSYQIDPITVTIQQIIPEEIILIGIGTYSLLIPLERNGNSFIEIVHRFINEKKRSSIEF